MSLRVGILRVGEARDAGEEQVQPGGRCGGLSGAAAQRGGLSARDLFPSQGELENCYFPPPLPFSPSSLFLAPVKPLQSVESCVALRCVALRCVALPCAVLCCVVLERSGRCIGTGAFSRDP